MASLPIDLIPIVKPYTMATEQRIALVAELCSRANDFGLAGDFVECGVCNGGMSAVLANYAKAANRTTWLFDSFEGLPEPGPRDLRNANGGAAEKYKGDCVGDMDKVFEVLKSVGADFERVEVRPGWFKDTLPSAEIPSIAVLCLDSDWYDSERFCLEQLYNLIVPGGYIYFDDYFYWPGARQAAIDYFKSIGFPHDLDKIVQRVEHSAWMQK